MIAFPPLILAAALALSAGLSWLFPLGLLADTLGLGGLTVAAVLLVAAGNIAILAMLAFRRAGTHIEPHKPTLALALDGPYRLTRNPMYIGLLLVHLAVTFGAALDWGVPMAVVLWLVLHRGVVLREERYLAARFGAPYQDYLARTRRWI